MWKKGRLRREGWRLHREAKERENDALAEAVAAYERALTISEKIGDSRLQAAALTGLAQACERRGDMDAARTYYRRAMPILLREADAVRLGKGVIGKVADPRLDARRTLVEIQQKLALLEGAEK